MKRVLVVSAGNACRSQMAEGYLQFYGEGKAQYFSAVLAQGDVHPLAIKVMTEDSIDMTWQVAQPLESFKNAHFDYVIDLHDGQPNDFSELVTSDHIYPLHIPNPSALSEAHPPPIEAFRQVRELIRTHILKFIGKELTGKEEVALP